MSFRCLNIATVWRPLLCVVRRPLTSSKEIQGQSLQNLVMERRREIVNVMTHRQGSCARAWQYELYCKCTLFLLKSSSLILVKNQTN